MRVLIGTKNQGKIEGAKKALEHEKENSKEKGKEINLWKNQI